MSDINRRSLAKTLTWRVTGSGATFLISWLISGDLRVAGIIGIVQLLCNTILYYMHERVWNMITWGRVDSKQDSSTDYRS